MNIHYDFKNGYIWKYEKKTDTYKCYGNQPNYKPKYYMIRIDGKNLYLHRVLYSQYNNIPLNELVGEIDHIDMNKKNNALNNLRLVTRSENNLNRPIQTNNKCNYKFIYFTRHKNRYAFEFKLDKVCKYFKTLEQAIEFRNNYFKNHDQLDFIRLE